MSDADRDQVEIIRSPDGRLIAYARVGEQTFTHDLPHGFDSWSGEEQRAHMKRFVAPWLKTRVQKARQTTEPLAQEDPREETKALTSMDQKRLDVAQAKRERRRLKLVN